MLKLVVSNLPNVQSTLFQIMSQDVKMNYSHILLSVNVKGNFYLYSTIPRIFHKPLALFAYPITWSIVYSKSQFQKTNALVQHEILFT